MVSRCFPCIVWHEIRDELLGVADLVTEVPQFEEIDGFECQARVSSKPSSPAPEKAYIRNHPDTKLDADFLNIQGTMANGKKGVGGWTWTRNKRYVDDAIARGDDIRLVTSPDTPLYQGGNTYQRELKYLRDKGYAWEQAGDHWIPVRTRP